MRVTGENSIKICYMNVWKCTDEAIFFTASMHSLKSCDILENQRL